ncbi:glutathione S-transferase [Novosphingobium sp. PS1R-30]|uniref:Glutathione S-transferase n=1 Tax=Novosphingobium anseongense TaxID=3133436 RepID=A0ABU8RTE9_9SPHN|nr:MAG: glutathione S-transferase [Novosphingobium sp.]
MQLYASAPSPFVRKVRIALIELGIEDRVEIVSTVPLDDPAYRAVNPLGKIPALRRPDGSVLYDSLVIVDWLDQTFGEGRLIPRDAAARNAELHQHALANGVIDAAFNATSELRRPEDLRSDFWLGRWSEAIVAGAAALAAEPPVRFGLGAITAAVAADYVPFRLGQLGLDISGLAAWRESLGARASLEATAPHREFA